MNPTLALLAAGSVLGAGAQVALLAVAFVAASWQRQGPEMLGSLLFAPFAVLALVLPLGAVPIARKAMAGATPPGPGLPVTGLLMWLRGEASMVGLALAGGARAIDVPLSAHALLAAYAGLAGALTRRRPSHAPTIPEPE